MSDDLMSDGPAHVLVVDDDAEIRDLLARYLAGQNLRVSTAEDCRSCLRRLEEGGVDIAVMDVMMPDGSGIDLCRDMRAKGVGVPVILLTALRDDVDLVVGLEVGADDYLGKPFSPRVLLARIRAVLRRTAEGLAAAPAPTKVYRFEGFVVESASRRVIQGDQDVELTSAEFDLLETLLARPGRVLSRDQLLDLTRGRGADSLDRSIDVLISRLRRKLRDDGVAPIIRTIRNGGYQFAARVQVTTSLR